MRHRVLKNPPAPTERRVIHGKPVTREESWMRSARNAQVRVDRASQLLDAPTVNLAAVKKLLAQVTFHLQGITGE